MRTASILLVGPYDPHCGEYTFLAPPLGVWRLAGVLTSKGFVAEVFDPNCVDGKPEDAFEELLRSRVWDVIGISTTAMTLKWDLALAHSARRSCPEAMLVAGGMEATFNPGHMFEVGPFDLVVLGEGERPLVELLRRRADSQSAGFTSGVAGTAWRSPDGSLQRIPQPALTRDELRDAIFATPYHLMPYERYWRRLESAYRIGALPTKADREARLAEIRSARLITLNYCPMRCTFCSSTNFLNAAQDGTARIARLEAAECLAMIRTIVATHPGVRTIIFQDDIFVFPNDRRIEPLTRAIIDAKGAGDIPASLQFISTNRIDALSPDRLAAMREAGFRVLGFGIENFSLSVLQEFNKHRIHPHIRPVLEAALANGITPFLDVILTSPRCSMDDVAQTLRGAFYWIEEGCEVGIYPYVIPFSGTAMSNDPALRPHTTFTTQHVPGTAIGWQQATKILPIDDDVRNAILEIESRYEERLQWLQAEVAHLPSRVRSLLWIGSAIPVLAARGHAVPGENEAVEVLLRHLPPLTQEQEIELRTMIGERALARATSE